MTTATADSYGGLIFEHRAGSGTTVGLFLLAVFFIAAGPQLDLLPVTLASVAIGAALATLGVSSARKRYRCFERGLTRRSLLGERGIRYDDLRSLQYSEVAVRMHGIHTRTTALVRFEPAAGGRAVSFSKVVPAGKEASLAPLREVRDRASGFVAERLLRHLADNGSVEWTRGVRLTTEGVEFAPKKRGPNGLLPLKGLEAAFEAGFLHLKPQGAAAPALSIAARTPNFFPGLRLFESLRAQARAG